MGWQDAPIVGESTSKGSWKDAPLVEDKQPTQPKQQNPFIAAIQSAGKTAMSSLPSPSAPAGSLQGMGMGMLPILGRQNLYSQVREQGKQALGVSGLGSDIALDPGTYEGLLMGGFGTKKAGEKLGQEAGLIKKWTNPQNQLDLANEARSALVQAKHNAVESFGEDYAKHIAGSDKTIKINSAIEGLKQNAEDGLMELATNPDFAGSLAKNQPMANRIKGLIDSFDAAAKNEIPVQEADKLQKWIKQLPGIKSKLGQVSRSGWNSVDWTNSERILLDFANDLKSETINQIPELSLMNKNYATAMKAIKGARGQLGFGTATDNLKNFSTKNIEIKNAFNQAIPETTKKIQELSKTVSLAELLKKIGIGAASTLVGGGVAGEGFNLMARR